MAHAEFSQNRIENSKSYNSILLFDISFHWLFLFIVQLFLQSDPKSAIWLVTDVPMRHALLEIGKNLRNFFDYPVKY